MASSSTTFALIFLPFLFFFFFLVPNSHAKSLYGRGNLTQNDINLLEFPLNLEYLEAEFFSFGAFGHGLDEIAPELTGNGPSPIGAKVASLGPLVKDITAQFAFQEVGHLRAIKSAVKGFPRPLLDLSVKSFATIINNAFGENLNPPFDPYANDLNYLIASYVIPYVGLTGYVGANPKLQTATAKRMIAGLLGVESGQDAVLRALLYERQNETVNPYGMTVAEFTNKISKLRNDLGNKGIKDEGLTVNPSQGAEGKIKGNILAGDKFSLAFDRTPEEILRIIYGTGSESKPGGFYPDGAQGRIAESHLHHHHNHQHHHKSHLDHSDHDEREDTDDCT
ncbi:OLC1v1020557C1 [Oldenlandia corymbosa var. corymbosa]|uniref:OLC1v1020557C1 n=1 Tax=Oldenlandia corymbosa var. corymbosa TaxID=529605 RepID=A0AAV1EGW7_OLDCO|nr:OLC1v1020557C1 [Oldenlandia corymbosa var. corymbosa]